MKRAKMFLTAIAVVATVGSALAVTNYFGSGSVFCSSTCTTNRVNFRNDPAGTSVKPCGTTGGIENASYIFDEGNVCRQNALGQNYSTTAAGN